MSGKTILIIDDDQDLLLGLTARLRANGYRAISAMDGTSAIAVARKETPDLIILDLGLPAGDGFVVLERLKALADLGAIPVIVLSARDPAGNKTRALDAGAVGFFQKPPDNHEFLDAIRHALEETPALSTFLET
jgi:two-component system KDP operon response regulator KdpE